MLINEFPGKIMIKKNDVVKIRPEYRDTGDNQIIWIACEDESNGRLIIEAQIGLPINPQVLITSEMVER